MRTRIITAVLGIPFVIVVLAFGNPWLKLTMMLLSFIALFELYGVVKKEYRPIQWIGYSGILLYYLFFDIMTKYYTLFLGILIIAILTYMVIKYPKYSIVDVAVTVFSVLYCSLLFSFMILTRELEYGFFWVWLVPISAWGSDTCAYFTGVSIGKHKLAPLLSPKKTIEGSIGGVLGAGVIGYFYTIIFAHWSEPILGQQVIFVVIAVMLGAIVSQFGDLAASAIKRFFNEKDFGNILPGHGGILDRFDSFLFVAPVIYVAIIISQNVMS